VDTPTRTTELEAVNVCMALMGNAPVNSLTAPYGADVATARNLITEVSKDVQMEGWHFNTEYEYDLVPSSNTITLASNMLSVDVENRSDMDVTFRDDRLYDLKNHTFTFTETVKATVIWMFPFDEIPEAFRRYIMIRAARRFQARYLGSEKQHMFTEVDETRARVNMLSSEGNSADRNILNSPDQAYIARRWSRRRYYW
jgi:Autographiviridae tail tubular protein Gp11